MSTVSNAMDSPVLSRSPSATFGPSSRRSHPNLQHLSLAPLTPKYPIDPADYNAYFDPSTSELHTSASLSQISGLPSPGGILTNSPARSRAHSRTRLRKKVKSSVSIQEPNDTVSSTKAPHGAVSSAGYGYISSHTTKSGITSRTNSRLHLRATSTPDPNWLIQTGLTLTESNRESKGQSWLSKRDSSTSLAGTPSTPYPPAFSPHTHHEGNNEADGLQRFYTARSGRNTPASLSRNASRNASRTRRVGRRDLVMTTGASADTQSDPSRRSIEEQDRLDEDVEPDWADPATQAEIAAQVHRDLAEYGGSTYSLMSGYSDPYGMLDFENNFEDDESDEEGGSGDEAEVKRAMGRWGVGGWLSLEGAVDAMLRLEEEAGNDSDENDASPKRNTTHHVDHDRDVGDVEVPPEQPKGAWDDIAWFGRLIANTIRS